MSTAREITYGEGIREALVEEMRRDVGVILYGEDVARFGGIFGVLAGLRDEFGERVFDTPISETAIVGSAVGAAMRGMRPVAELQFADFVFCAGDEIFLKAATWRYVWNAPSGISTSPCGGWRSPTCRFRRASTLPMRWSRGSRTSCVPCTSWSVPDMPTPIRMPRLGHSMTEGTVLAWLVPKGAEVRAGQPVVSIETEKAEYEIEAPADGRLSEPLVHEQATTTVGTVLAYILAPGETIAPDAPPAPRHDVRPPGVPLSRSGAGPVSPRARRLARELGVDLSGISGTGVDGLIVEADVQRAAASGPSEGRRICERRPLTAIQKTSARRVAEAWREIPHIVQMVEADVSAIQQLRQQWKANASQLAAITFTDFVIKAGADALVQHPALNASIVGDELVLYADINAGLAVETPRGLLVPVIRSVDRRTLLEVALDSKQLADAARQRRLTPDRMGAGSFTVSNLGAFGIRAGLPILNPPEAVLVFVGAVEERAVVRDRVVVARPMVTLSIAYDHRVADGAAAARLSGAIKTLIEHPGPLVAGLENASA